MRRSVCWQGRLAKVECKTDRWLLRQRMTCVEVEIGEIFCADSKE